MCKLGTLGKKHTMEKYTLEIFVVFKGHSMIECNKLTKTHFGKIQFGNLCGYSVLECHKLTNVDLYRM